MLARRVLLRRLATPRMSEAVSAGRALRTPSHLRPLLLKQAVCVPALWTVRRGEYRLVYISEKYLFDYKGMEILEELHAAKKLKLLAIDEAHCVVEYGEKIGFRPDYARLGELRTKMPGVPMLALSATATPEIWGMIRSNLHFTPQHTHIARASICRTNLALRVVMKPSSLKGQLQALVNELVHESATSTPQPTIVYTHYVGFNTLDDEGKWHRKGVLGVHAQLEEMLKEAGGNAKVGCTPSLPLLQVQGSLSRPASLPPHIERKAERMPTSHIVHTSRPACCICLVFGGAAHQGWQVPRHSGPLPAAG